MTPLPLGILLVVLTLLFVVQIFHPTSPITDHDPNFQTRGLKSTKPSPNENEISSLREEIAKLKTELEGEKSKWTQELKYFKEQELVWKNHNKQITLNAEECHDSLRNTNQTLSTCSSKLIQLSTKLKSQETLETRLTDLTNENKKVAEEFQKRNADFQALLKQKESCEREILAMKTDQPNPPPNVQHDETGPKGTVVEDSIDNSAYLNKFSSLRLSPTNPQLILDGEWDSAVWGDSFKIMQEGSTNGVKIENDGFLILHHANLFLESSRFFDDAAAKKSKDPQIVGTTFHFERVTLREGLFRFALLFANEAGEYRLNSRSLFITCRSQFKNCDVNRAHSTYSFWKERRVKVLKFGPNDPKEPLDISLTIRKIGCDFYLLSQRVGDTTGESLNIFMLNNLEFCSDNFIVKMVSEGTVNMALSPLRVSRFHGSCSIPTVCQCFPTWSGEHCNVPGLSKYDNSYEERFQQLIERLQNPPDCSKARALVFHWKLHGLGFGNSIHWMLAAFTWSIKLNRTFLLADRDTWQYADAKACPSRSYHCYFLPVSKCNVSSLADENETQLLNSTMNERVLHTWVPHLYLEKDYARDNPLYNQTEEMDIIPAEFNNKGLIWWYSQLIAQAWKLNPQTAKIVEDFKRAIKLPAQYFGMHVRRGDKIAETPNTPPDWYMQTIEQFNNYRVNLPSLNSIFLATDDPGIIDDFLAFKDYNWYYDHEEKRMNGTTLALWEGRANGTEQTLTIIKNIELLSKSQNFVSTFSSNFARMIHELKIGRGGSGMFAPASSVDLPFWDPLGKFQQW